MFCIEMAGIPIGIDNRYEYIERLCRGYEIEGKAPDFTVSVTEEELQKAQDAERPYSSGYLESLCLYRKICLRLAKYQAFLMHSAVVAVDEKAYVFTAPSGTGKTTHIRLWLEMLGERVQVLNGDKPLYRFIDGVLYACGTPWQGKEHMGENIMRPVQGICFLEQSPENHIRTLSASEVTRRIFRQLLLPQEEEELDRYWALLEKMLDTVPFYLLECNRDPEAAHLSYETMRRKKIC